MHQTLWELLNLNKAAEVTINGYVICVKEHPQGWIVTMTPPTPDAIMPVGWPAPVRDGYIANTEDGLRGILAACLIIAGNWHGVSNG